MTEPGLPLEGRRVVVTGAARGLGASAALALAGAGAECLLLDRSATELDATAARLRGGARTLIADLSDRAGRRRAARDAIRFAAGDLAALVHCAGVLRRRPIAETADRDWDETIAVNLTSGFVLLRELLPALGAGAGGSVVFTSSNAGVRGFAGETAYCASKFGIEGLARAAAAECAGVGVNTVTPGARIKPTGMTGEAERRIAPDRRAWGSSEPLGRAFVALALLPDAGGTAVSGRRFRCDRVAARIETDGLPLHPDAWEDLAE